MLSVTWMIDIDSNTEYLECRNEEAGSNEADVVKVYFHTKFDIATVRGKKLERPIAKAIFSNRERYGKVLDGWIEEMPNTVFFKTSTDIPVYVEVTLNSAGRIPWACTSDKLLEELKKEKALGQIPNIFK